jgi:peptidoglycan hydrolase-like protein with peptidoglycan-binding domain
MITRIALVAAFILLPAAASAAECPTFSRSFFQGARGPEVASLQHFLIAAGDLASDNATGFFGRFTDAAVRAWQERHGVVAMNGVGSGTVGPKTRAAITASCGKPSSQAPDPTQTPTQTPSQPSTPAVTPPQTPASYIASPKRCSYRGAEYSDGMVVEYRGYNHVCENGAWFEKAGDEVLQGVSICERTDGSTRDSYFHCTGQPVSNIKFGLRPTFGSAPLVVKATISNFAPPSNQCGTGVIAWGDGTTSQITAPADCPVTTHYSTHTHTYQNPGKYTVTITSESGEIKTQEVSVVTQTAYRSLMIGNALSALEAALERLRVMTTR